MLTPCCCFSVAKSSPTLCNPMTCSISGFHVLHYLPEFPQTHVYWLMMPSNHLILCHLLLLPSILPSIRVFPNESALCIRQGQSIGASASASVLPMNIQGWFPLGLTGWISLQSMGLSRVFSSIIVWNHQFFGALPSLWSKTLTSIPNYWKDHSLDISDVFAFQYTIQVCHSFATVCKCAKSQRPITSQQ